ncbi:MAG: HEAT repeat domain-containing protein [Chloroflexi bacterium]|nr:HEAT repeat domain-containing protein [Chloroflexota bacterium]
MGKRCAICRESLFASDWHARREAATALREQAKSLRGIADRSVINLLLNALSNTDYVVRWAVVEALAWIKDVSVAPNLMYLLRDPVSTVAHRGDPARCSELGDNSVILALTGRAR